MRLGVDTGGTFTDFALLANGRLQTHKVLSTPEAPELAIIQGIRDLDLEAEVRAGRVQVIHGSTVATNAALENKGASTLYVGNTGLEDLLELGRQNRPELYNLTPSLIEPPVPNHMRLGIDARVGSDGNELAELAERDLECIEEAIRKHRPEAVALCLLFSFLNPAHERRIVDHLRQRFPELFVSGSAEVYPQSGEYERGIATWLNASLGPRMGAYLRRLAKAIPSERLAVMQSSGGTISADRAADRAVHLLLSGPAGGLAAAEALQKHYDEGLLTFDMGGTSTDVALVRDGIRLTSEGRLGRWPVAVPMVDMHTIGAGGGSIAWLDGAGMLHVGPQSAGAQPGPACYGQGGREPTVTDAHLVLGHFASATFGGGSLTLDREAALRAFRERLCRAGEDEATLARGVIELAEEHMARALREISEQRGEDPAHYRLCCFGGAGGLHVCALAEKLGINRAMMPAQAGILSALGMLLAPGVRDLEAALSRGECRDLAGIHQRANELEELGRGELVEEGHNPKSIGSTKVLRGRYAGQTFTLEVPLVKEEKMAELERAFADRHERTYGCTFDRPVEWVSLGVRISAPSPAPLPSAEGINAQPSSPPERTEILLPNGKAQSVAVYQRDRLTPREAIQGPAIVLEPNATLLLQDHWIAEPDKLGNLLLSRSGT